VEVVSSLDHHQAIAVNDAAHTAAMVNLPRSERHGPGIGRLCYSPDGAVLYTAGSEGFLRVFSAIPEDDNNDQLALIDYHEDTGIYTMDASVSLFFVLDMVGPSLSLSSCTRINRWKVSLQARKTAKQLCSTTAVESLRV
jgi:hypothetical protein